MASPQTLKRVETWTWILIFGGLLTLVFAFIGRSGGLGFNWYVGGAGLAAVAFGIVLIWVRSRLNT